MQDMEDYLQIMIDSLNKKKELLKSIVEKNNRQRACIENKSFDDVDWNAFNVLITEKEFVIDRINKMDEGFQSLYDRVKEQINEGKEKYASSIKIIQGLIQEITDLGVAIRTSEERNRQLIETVMMGRKSEIKKTRNSLKVARSYFDTMRGGDTTNLSTMDKKK